MTQKRLIFDHLYTLEGLEGIDNLFRNFLQGQNGILSNLYEKTRKNSSNIKPLEESHLVVQLYPYVEQFLAQAFKIEENVKTLQSSHKILTPLHICKRNFVQRRAIKKYTPQDATSFGPELRDKLEKHLGAKFSDLAFATQVSKWCTDETLYEEEIILALKYAAWACLTKTGQCMHKESVLFELPKKIDPKNLVETTETPSGALQACPENIRHRKGFDLTDQGPSQQHAFSQAHYCIFCHERDKDSCSKGFKEKSGEGFKKNDLNIPLTGCPLEQKISEMNLAKSAGFNIGALAIICIDNPMVAATGHRICNDCMKSCIFQKQTPVDIPGIETQILKEVLALPWGFEIYSLLTRWNPLNFKNPLPLPKTSKKVLVVGMGPAGFTLSHHLMNAGHTVVGMDGLKIEPLPSSLSGVDVLGNNHSFQLIENAASLFKALSERIVGGFGGVAEYGITARWDKNFLTVVRLLLERRRPQFNMLSGIRFGGTLTEETAFNMGFDHIALCMGAGQPKLIPMKNRTARGVKMASDFLMNLQLSNTSQEESNTNLQMRLPVVVIGGGLTAIDTATEALAYYPIQVERFLKRYESLVCKLGEEKVRCDWTEEDQIIADEFISHAQAIRLEKEKARQENRAPNILKLLNQWGGVTIAYRKQLIESPSYRLNHEEVKSALEEGIQFLENITPLQVETDSYGHTSSLIVERKASKAKIPLAAKSIFVAAGTKPNTIIAKENEVSLSVCNDHFQALDLEENLNTSSETPRRRKSSIFTSIRPDGRSISFLGDLHPSYAGNVVKAMASAKQGAPLISMQLAKCAPNKIDEGKFQQDLNQKLRAQLLEIKRLTPKIIELVIKAPQAARAFKPGQFFRLQNFEAITHGAGHTQQSLEGLALTGASVDLEAGTISTIVLEMGGSSDLCTSLLKPKDPVILMGPTGSPTYIPSKETVLLIGGGLGNAVLMSIGKALKANGSKVLYFAGYKENQDRFKKETLENAADCVVWCCEESPGFSPTRSQDKAFHGNIIEALHAYGTGKLGNTAIPMSDVQRIITIGSANMMAAVKEARHSSLKPLLSPDHLAIGSINSPMQCMMKEICGQCIQRQVDPITKLETIVFSCTNQDQSLDRVDFSCLKERLNQNRLSESLTRQWIASSLRRNVK
ncbi:MAG: FAD-dependent oxidoreductase [Alphaproteobacteria bacterium]|jgi:NADPH-dependent glutamate synthase beta subunit-like oxidoreductase/NAD(P)H-flavin reductase|nr:FAD-dependent oxidoreductase [Alphaproteobacteria bacterium]MBT5389638.1 FAD-dependent oxidoreductase [Alphaproteobacteria bacterium]MBT5655073.1 FAD-dependent oxidoreductase [Alphaproteobacteria bacterium]